MNIFTVAVVMRTAYRNKQSKEGIKNHEEAPSTIVISKCRFGGGSRNLNTIRFSADSSSHASALRQ